MLEAVIQDYYFGFRFLCQNRFNPINPVPVDGHEYIRELPENLQRFITYFTYG